MNALATFHRLRYAYERRRTHLTARTFAQWSVSRVLATCPVAMCSLALRKFLHLSECSPVCGIVSHYSGVCCKHSDFSQHSDFRTGPHITLLKLASLVCTDQGEAQVGAAEAIVEEFHSRASHGYLSEDSILFCVSSLIKNCKFEQG